MEEHGSQSSGSGARYDGWSDWYDAYLKGPLYAEVPKYLAGMVGSGVGLCVDAGCGTGAYIETLVSLGWSVVGLDVSRDQLRIARTRASDIALADASFMPFSGASAARVVSVLTLTDLDDVKPFFEEAHRILAPGGRLVVLTTHPCFVGPFVKSKSGSGGEDIVAVYPGYWDTRRVFTGPGIGNGVRSRVGVRHVPLSELLDKLIDCGLVLKRVEEFGTGTVPWLLGFAADKPDESSPGTPRDPRHG